jgi:hypothetical protein
LIWFNVVLFDIFLEPIGHLLRDKDHFELLATFGIPDDQFPAINIPRRQIEHLADPHPSTGHQFQHKTVSGFDCSENEFVDNLLFQNSPLNNLGRLEQFPQHWDAAWIFKLGIESIFDEIKER